MLIAATFIRQGLVVLQDADFSEVELTAQDALDMGVWIARHYQELEKIVEQEKPKEKPYEPFEGISG